MKTALIGKEIGLHKKIKERYDKIMAMIEPSHPEHSDYTPKLLDECGEWAHELHMSLTNRGVEVKHHKYMIKNRGYKSDHQLFYHQIHAIQDLLKFIEDNHANDDPVDVTIGCEFTFEVYSRRWGGIDVYKVVRIKTGWEFTNMSDGGKCAKTGRKHLYELLDHDSINYPEELPGYLEYLWEQANTQGLTKEQVQESLNQLAEWVNLCERNSPEGIFNGYK